MVFFELIRFIIDNELVIIEFHFQWLLMKKGSDGKKTDNYQNERFMEQILDENMTLIHKGLIWWCQCCSKGLCVKFH